MSAASGMLMLVLSFVLVVVARRATLRATPPWWASDNILGNIVCPLIVGLLAVGGALLIRFAVRAASGAVEMTEVASLGVVVAAACLVFAVWRRHATAGRAALADVLPFPAADEAAPAGPPGPHHRNAA